MTTERHTDERKHVAETVRGERLQRGLSVQEAADMMGVNASAWSRWESGASTPRPAMLRQIGDTFGLPDGWMIPHATPTTSDINERLDRIDERQAAMFDAISAERQRLEEIYNKLRDI